LPQALADLQATNLFSFMKAVAAQKGDPEFETSDALACNG
jgi:hypothetical protein